MKVKERVIRDSIKICEKKVKKLKADIFANPLSDLITLQRDTIEAAKKMDLKDSGPFLKKAIRKEKQLRKLCEDQIKHSDRWMDELTEYESELGELKNDLYYLERQARN